MTPIDDASISEVAPLPCPVLDYFTQLDRLITSRVARQRPSTTRCGIEPVFDAWGFLQSPSVPSPGERPHPDVQCPAFTFCSGLLLSVRSSPPAGVVAMKLKAWSVPHFQGTRPPVHTPPILDANGFSVLPPRLVTSRVLSCLPADMELFSRSPFDSIALVV